MPDAVHHRTILRRLVPGVILPGLIYLVAVQFLPVLGAIALASAVPVLETLVRLALGKPPNGIGVVVIGLIGLSAGLAFWSGSEMFILARGAVISGLLGLAFGVSAVLGRPLTRTLALRLSTEHGPHRHRMAELWAHPRALRVFTVLAVGWGLWLLFSAAQQAVVLIMLPPAAVIALESPLQALATAVGIAVSVTYARRSQRRHPEIALLPARA